MRAIILAVAMSLAAGGAWAADRVLILANARHAQAPDVAGARAVAGIAASLRVAGWEVTVAADRTAPQMRAALSALLAQVAPDDRVVILLAGHFVEGAGGTWLLGTEAASPDVATVGGTGLDLRSVLAVAGGAPGGAAVMLGTEARRLALGAGLAAGIGPLDVPQGVAVVRGDAARIADFAARQVVRREVSLASMLTAAPDLTAEGFLPADWPLRPAAAEAPVAVTPQVPTQAERAEEDAAWAEARRRATPESHEVYLQRYPAGRYAAEARAEVARLRAEPAVQARLAEEALGLTRDQRRAIQRQLSLLGFDPRGIDGLFGPGSRAAISAWQTRNGETVTGFLTRDQILRLQAQADRRAAELEAEAAERRAETERQDRLYWDQTGAAGDEAGLRAYLRQYPDGLFAELATERLGAIDDARRREAAAQDRAAWDRAVAADTAAAYREYLAAQPRGAFAENARTRIEDLQAEAAGAGDRARARAAEDALNLNVLARNLIEQRLAGLGFSPGVVDGVFDDSTRRAIRRFQASRGIDETGYLDQTSMVALLAGGVLRMGE